MKLARKIQIIMYNNSNKKIIRYLFRFLIVIVILNILKWTIYDKYFVYDDLIDEIHRKNLKAVQLVTGRFDFENWEFDRLGEEPFKSCPEQRCYAFRSLGLLHVPNERSDGIMVHGPNLWYMPSKARYKRNPKQLWLFYSMEPQRLTFCSSHYDLTELDDVFNITATFKYGSDLLVDYKQFRTWDDVIYDLDYIREYKLLFSGTNLDPISSVQDLSAKNKSKASVVWFVSHCETNSRREEYISEMRKHIDIDIYGKCDNYFENAAHDPCKSKKNVKCFDKLMNEYKFYITFENSLCTDYISEKFWKLYDSDKIFAINIIPVVRGPRREQYQRAVGKEKLYILADDFGGPKELADYLNYLSSNDTAYLEYFEWKMRIYEGLDRVIREEPQKIRMNSNVSTFYHLREPFCKICSQLHNSTYMNSNTNKRWDKFSEWYSVKNNCWDWEEERVFFYNVAKFFGFCF